MRRQMHSGVRRWIGGGFEWMGQLVDAEMNEWVGWGWMAKWLDGRMDEWGGRPMGGKMDVRRVGRWTSGGLDRTSGYIHRRMDEWIG